MVHVYGSGRIVALTARRIPLCHHRNFQGDDACISWEDLDNQLLGKLISCTWGATSFQESKCS